MRWYPKKRKKIDISLWHDWFAWHPVKLQTHPDSPVHAFAWLTTVERRWVTVPPPTWASDDLSNWLYR